MRSNSANDQQRGRRGRIESRQRRRQRLKPTLLALEERQLLSTFVVTSVADSAPASGEGSAARPSGVASQKRMSVANW